LKPGVEGRAHIVERGGSPTARRNSSRSRAVSAVDTCLRRLPLRRAHTRPNNRKRRIHLLISALPTGKLAGSRSKKRGSAACELKHCMAVRAPTPRGSQLTQSKRARNSAGKSPNAREKNCLPDAPGPPGLKNSTPRRRAGSLARCLITARWISVCRGAR
jgi:hypothetical protein